MYVLPLAIYIQGAQLSTIIMKFKDCLNLLSLLLPLPSSAYDPVQ